MFAQAENSITVNVLPEINLNQPTMTTSERQDVRFYLPGLQI